MGFELFKDIAVDLLGFIIVGTIIGLFIKGPVKEGIHNMSKTLSDTFKTCLISDMLPTIKTTVEATRNGVITLLNEAVSSRNLQEELLGDMTPIAKELIEKGDLPEAEKILKRSYLKDPSNSQTLLEYLDILLMSGDVEKYDLAQGLLEQKGNLLDIKILLKKYLTMAYRYFFLGNLDKAIEINEKGLRLAEQQDSNDQIKELISKYKSSLAYYYAETQKPELEDKARLYSEEACLARPDNPHPKDTKGYVKIVYGKTKEEILEGLTLCGEAWKEGIDEAFHIKHIGIAHKRLSSFH